MVYTKLRISLKEKKVGMCVPMNNETDMMLGEQHFLYNTVFLKNNTEYTMDRGDAVWLQDNYISLKVQRWH